MHVVGWAWASGSNEGGRRRRRRRGAIQGRARWSCWTAKEVERRRVGGGSGALLAPRTRRGWAGSLPSSGLPKDSSRQVSVDPIPTAGTTREGSRAHRELHLQQRLRHWGDETRQGCCSSSRRRDCRVDFLLASQDGRKVNRRLRRGKGERWDREGVDRPTS